ncbi:hypothetical protein B0J11DRAFT_579767 [Dendryphion nanum]|uniref:Uncharacterized protein n=1 Tax=Dendryphion nanum TaxID=256645 RepID=A0A9P9DR68_9PLEO|nr:hypothetical protein B0J11DRAFT_579767 [Dendryphion nanum]
MEEQLLHDDKILDIYTPKTKIATAFHRRGDRFFLVLPRAYGMAEGWKLWGELNFPKPSDPSPDPPSSHPRLNPRFWFREGKDQQPTNTLVSLEDLLQAEVPFLKDTGMRRSLWVSEDRDAREVDEVLVEVIIKEAQYCQRCAYCGAWEYSYPDSARHQRVGKGKTGRPWYWCGDCSRSAKPFSLNWWYDPDKLPDRIYFQLGAN